MNARLAAWGLAVAALSAAGGQDTLLGRQVPAAADAPSAAITRTARAHYLLHCAGCHGLDGAGSPAAQVPDMRRLGDFLRVPGGRSFVLKVPGVMGSGLGDAEVAAVTNWVLGTLAGPSVPPGTEPFSADEVAHARRQPLLDVAAARRGIVQQARSQGLTLD